MSDAAREPSPKPIEDDFDTTDEYHKALQEWRRQRRLAQIRHRLAIPDSPVERQHKINFDHDSQVRSTGSKAVAGETGPRPAAPLHALPRGFDLDEYEFVRVLGAGGFGITYLAFDHKLNGPVALKEYFPAEFAARTDDFRVIASSSRNRDVFAWGLSRFQEEAQALHQLRHPNLVRVHRLIEACSTAYIVMEYVEGDPLTVLLQAHGPLSVSIWQPWLDQLLDGLAHVHRRGYLHRDITARNIMIREADHEPVLIDFGSARIAAGDHTHTLVRTPGYAPIEQYSNQTAQGPWTDIYALAAVSYRVLTGKAPPEAPSRLLDDQYEPLAGPVDQADRAWLEAIDHGLAPRPADRPQTAAAWLAQLEAARDKLHSPPAPMDRATVAELMVAASIKGDSRALARLHEAAEEGSAEAQVVLGQMHADGTGVSRDDALAVTWYRKAANRGFAEGQFNLGYMYQCGKGVPQDDAQAAKWYRKAADQGDEAAQYILGNMYEAGIGVARDDVQAAEWYSKAAAQGDKTAQYTLGNLYEEGRGVARNERRAAAWYCQAADQGEARAQYRLGVMHAQGRGVPQDDKQAVEWLRTAAEQDHAEAQVALGRMYVAGTSLAADSTKAVAWFRRAANQGHVEAQCLVAMAYDEGRGIPADPATAVAWYRKAADRGYSPAQYCLGVMYIAGHGVTADEVEAVNWTRKAAEQGLAAAQMALARMYGAGRGVPANDREALAWLRKAADQGHAEAQCLVAAAYEEGRGTPADHAQAVAWYRKAANQGVAAAQIRLGGMHASEAGMPTDPVQVALGADWLGVVVSRDDVESSDISSTLSTLCSLLVDKTTVRQLQGRVRISFDGFNHDPREIYEIPEIRRFCAQLDERFPYWLYFLSTEGSSLKMMAFCLCRTESKGAGLAEINAADLGRLLHSRFLAMNKLFVKYSLDEQKYRAISSKLLEYFQLV